MTLLDAERALLVAALAESRIHARSCRECACALCSAAAGYLRTIVDPPSLVAAPGVCRVPMCGRKRLRDGRCKPHIKNGDAYVVRRWRRRGVDAGAAR